MGNRATMLPDSYDAKWNHQSRRIHRLPKKVWLTSWRLLLSFISFQNKTESEERKKGESKLKLTRLHKEHVMEHVWLFAFLRLFFIPLHQQINKPPIRFILSHKLILLNFIVLVRYCGTVDCKLCHVQRMKQCVLFKLRSDKGSWMLKNLKKEFKKLNLYKRIFWKESRKELQVF